MQDQVARSREAKKQEAEMQRKRQISLFLCFFASLLLVSCSGPHDFGEQRRLMVERQVLWRGITNQRVLDAMLSVPREEFVLPEFRNKAYADNEIPVGEEQTLDRPYEDAFIMQSLGIAPTYRILEIGTGGGYLTALLAKLAKEIYTIDIIPILVENAKNRFTKLGYTNIHTKAGDGFLGWPEFAPFNAVVFTCSPPEIPQPIIDQTAEGGKILLPLGGEAKFQELLLYTKKDGKFGEPRRLAAATFTPMKGKVLEK